MNGITACLWFDGVAEEATHFYAATIPGSSVGKVVRAPADYPSGKKGDVLTVEFTLASRPFLGLNGGLHFKFNEAVSFVLPCADQTEVDRLWDALSAVPEAEQCGWCKDCYGLSWQIVPDALPRLLADPDPVRRRGSSVCDKSVWRGESEYKSMAHPRGSRDRNAFAICSRLDHSLLAGMGLSVDFHRHIDPHHPLANQAGPRTS